jgi:hypothetical protein
LRRRGGDLSFARRKACGERKRQTGPQDTFEVICSAFARTARSQFLCRAFGIRQSFRTQALFVVTFVHRTISCARCRGVATRSPTSVSGDPPITR